MLQEKGKFCPFILSFPAGLSVQNGDTLLGLSKTTKAMPDLNPALLICSAIFNQHF